MRHRNLRTALALGVAVVVVTSAIAIGGPPQQGGSTVVVQKVEVKTAEAKPAAKAFAPMMRIARPLNLAQTFLIRFRPILRAEYHVVRAVCRPTPEQRKAIAQDAEKMVRKAAEDYVAKRNRPMNVAERVALDPRRQIREGLAGLVEKHCSGEAADRYRQEVARREEARKRLAARNIVVRLDERFILTPDQRQKIEGSLIEHWNDIECSSLRLLISNNRQMSQIPDAYVTPFLYETQKAAWQAIPTRTVYASDFDIQGVMMNDPLEDEELRAARLEAEKDDPKPAPNANGPVLIFDGGAVAPAAKAAVKT